MKKILLLFGIVIFLLSCNNIETKKQLTQAQKDSIQTQKDFILLDSVSKAESSKFPPPTGFLGIDWYSSKEEAIKLLKTKDSIQIKDVTNVGAMGVSLTLKGYFAGHKVKDILLIFYCDKFCNGSVNFGIQSSDFNEKFLNELNKKYGAGMKIKKGYVWNFYPFNDNGAKIYFTENEDLQQELYYIAPDETKYSERQNSEYHAMEKKDIRIKSKEL